MPGIRFCLIGEGDLSQALGYPRHYELSEVADAMQRIAETCYRHKVIVGDPPVGAKNVGRLLSEGYRFLMSAPARSYGVVGQGRELAGY